MKEQTLTLSLREREVLYQGLQLLRQGAYAVYLLSPNSPPEPSRMCRECDQLMARIQL